MLEVYSFILTMRTIPNIAFAYFDAYHWKYEKVQTFGTPSISYNVPIISIISGSSIDPLPSLSYILNAHL